MISPLSRSDGLDAAVRLDILGRLSLSTGRGNAGAVLGQAKRLALLAWLALRRPGGYVRRDELLGVFWPDSPEVRARAALRQGIQYLRRHLGDDIVTNRGREELGIDSGVLACDALTFLDAVEAGADDVAVACYGGDLLPGLLLAGLHDFERWLHGERQRLRTLAIQAALREAGRAEADHDDVAAAGRVAWALQLEPTSETVARRLMVLRARSGDRTAALATYEGLCAALRADLDLEPSPHTVELFRAVRDDAAHADLGSPTHGRGLSPQRVLVLELENRTGDPGCDVLGALAAETIAQGLAGVRELEVVPPLAVGPVGPAAGGAGADVRPADADPTLSDDVAALARRAGAGTVLRGSIHRTSDSLRFQVLAIDAAEGRLLRGPGPVLCPTADALEGIETLREQVLTSLVPALAPNAVHVREAARPPVMEAYRAYMDGLERFVRGEWLVALEYFRRSTELAPDYALPSIVSAIALWNLGDLVAARSAASRAASLRPALGRFERAVLDMVLAWLGGDWAAAYRAAQVQAELAPGSIPHFQVAEEARRLNRPREAREQLARLDPEAGELRGWIFYWVELATAHHMLRDHHRTLEVVSRCRRLHSDDPIAALLEVRAFAGLNRERDVDRVIGQALASPSGRLPHPGELLMEAALELQAHGSPAAATNMFRRCVDWHREQASRGAVFNRELARALYHAGELEEARSMFDRLVDERPGRVRPVGHHHPQLQAHLDEGFLAVIAARLQDAPAADRWCNILRELDTPYLYGAQWFWLAAVASLRHDADRAARMLARAFADGMPMEPFIHTDPHLARLRGDERIERLLRPRG